MGGAPADQSFGARSRNAALSLCVCLAVCWQAGRPDKVWRAARRLQQKLNLCKVARSVLPAHVLGGCDPTVPRAPMFPRWAPNHFRDPVIPMLQPAGENRNARLSIGQRTADDRPLIRQLIILRTAVPVLSSAGSLLRPDSAGSLLFSWPRDLRNLHTRVSSSRKLPYASPETQQE